MRRNGIQLVVLIAISVVVGYSALRMAVPARAAQNTSRSQMSPASPVKYAYVVARFDKAVICFVEPQGCRIQEVTAPPVTMSDAGRIFTDTAATQAVAFARAVSLLGEAGWEMVGSGPAYATSNAEEALHFRQGGR